ncbi:hypothetical protein HY468_02455 [Candidatus Roizmanbacteria bacterium]|nr:hypothetical protein [Candidatus Roizmanbacteria bacterium]
MTERTSWIEKAAELSKKVDDVGMVVGAAMVVFGLIFTAFGGAVKPGFLLGIGSGVSKWGGEKVRQWGEKRRRKKEASNQ